MGLTVPEIQPFLYHTPLLEFSILTIIRLSTWDMASEPTPTPQQLITQSAQATADAIASALTARTASFSLPIYDWNSQDAYHSFSIFCHTLENWLLLNHILPDSEDHLRYVFAVLGTKSLEMHTQWMPTGSKEEQKVTNAKASAFLDCIQQGMTHNVNTHVCLGELEEIVVRPGEDPKISLHASRHWWTTARWSMMSITSTNCIAVLSMHTATTESSLENLWPSHSRHPPMSWLTLLWTTLPSNMPENKSPTAPNLWTQSARTKGRQPTPATAAMVTHHLHPLRTVPTAHNSTQLAEQTAQHVIPVVPNVTRWDTGDQNAMVASHSNQGMHPYLGHSRGSPDGPPRNHNHCQGQNNKTDTIDVNEDHSPQDEIALHHIQPNMTVKNTHPEEIMVGDVCAPQCNEAYTTIQLPASASRKGTVSLHVKVNTRAGGNVLPLCVFWHLYPDQISPAGLPTGLDHINTRLTAYNGSHIPLYGALHGPITWQPDHPGSPPCRVKSYWYVADTPGPAILSLHSSEKLAVVKMNCAITVRWPSTHPAPVFHYSSQKRDATVPEAAKPIMSTDDLIKEFPEWFKGIGRFPSEYKIWLHHDAHPVIHAPRKCPIPMSEGQGAPWQDGMPRLGILHYLCPEGKWWATSVLGSPWPQWGHLPWSSQDTHCGGSCSWVCTLSLLKLDACHGYWSIVLDQDSSFLTLWFGLFPRHLPEKDGSDPQRMPRMYRNCRRHHHAWPHWGRTWCLPMRSHKNCPQIQLGVQPTEDTCEGPSHQFYLDASMMPMESTWTQARSMLYMPCQHPPTSLNFKSS